MTATPCAALVWSENFDELPAGTPGSCARISNTGADTPPNSLFIEDGASSCTYDLTNIPVPTASSVLRFRNNFNEYYAGQYDHGGVLEVSSPNINGGAFTDITSPAVGGSFIAGGYTGQVPPASSNPLAGRLVWGGSSDGYIDTIVNLGPNLAGQTVSFRFRFGSDHFNSAPGWHIDTLTIRDGVCPTPTPSPTLTPGTPTPTPSPSSTPTATPTPTASATPTSTAVPSATPSSQALNLSTRMRVQTGNNVGIGGFIIRGSAPK